MGGNFHGWLLICKKRESLTPQKLKHIWYVSKVWSVCSGFEAKTLHALMMAFTTSPVVDVMEGLGLSVEWNVAPLSNMLFVHALSMAMTAIGCITWAHGHYSIKVRIIYANMPSCPYLP